MYLIPFYFSRRLSGAWLRASLHRAIEVRRGRSEGRRRGYPVNRFLHVVMFWVFSSTIRTVNVVDKKSVAVSSYRPSISRVDREAKKKGRTMMKVWRWVKAKEATDGGKRLTEKKYVRKPQRKRAKALREEWKKRRRGWANWDGMEWRCCRGAFFLLLYWRKSTTTKTVRT